ncbi:MAG: sel1 repeat family protein, partial [Bacteroidaceae bacterium]|nr:sel1 repeat family protein [Bacteroidaceae bacterium]
FKWYRKAAELGNAGAQYKLGWYYVNSDEGIDKDLSEAVSFKWYRKAAEQGHAGAQYGLGWCYENGSGVDKDLSEAFKWYSKAAKQGHAGAKDRLKTLGVD